MDLAVISPVVFRLEFIDICFGCCCVDYVGYLNLDFSDDVSVDRLTVQFPLTLKFSLV